MNYDMYFTNPIKYERYSYRQHGQPKLPKPKELKNIKQSFSAKYIPKKCNFSCFCVGDDLWIKCNDFFSRSWRPPNKDIGAPTSYLLKKYFNKTEKFCYSDTQGNIVLRDEAWIVFKDIKQVFKRELPECSNENYVANQIASLMLDEFTNNDIIAYASLHNHMGLEFRWTRFFEDVCKKYVKWLKENQNNVGSRC